MTNTRHVVQLPAPAQEWLRSILLPSATSKTVEKCLILKRFSSGMNVMKESTEDIGFLLNILKSIVFFRNKKIYVRQALLGAHSYLTHPVNPDDHLKTSHLLCGQVKIPYLASNGTNTVFSGYWQTLIFL